MLKNWLEKQNNETRVIKYRDEKKLLKLILHNKLEALITIRYYTSEDLYYTIAQDVKQIPNIKNGDNGFIRWQFVRDLVPVEA